MAAVVARRVGVSAAPGSDSLARKPPAGACSCLKNTMVSLAPFSPALAGPVAKKISPRRSPGSCLMVDPPAVCEKLGPSRLVLGRCHAICHQKDAFHGNCVDLRTRAAAVPIDAGSGKGSRMGEKRRRHGEF